MASRDMSDGTSAGAPPATSLRLIWLCQIACSSKGGVQHTPSFGPYGALLRYDFAVPSESIGCSCAHLPPLAGRVPFRVDSQSPFLKKTIAAFPFRQSHRLASGIGFRIVFKIGSASRREKGPAPLGVGGERRSSRWTQMAQQNRSTGGPRRGQKRGCVAHPPSTSTRFGKAK